MAEASIEELVSPAASVRDDDLDTLSVREAAYAVIVEHTRTKATRPSSSRRRKRLAAAAGVVVLGAGLGTAAAQELRPPAHTGRHAEPEGETQAGGEWIRLDAPDTLDVVLALTAPIPLPPGTDRREVVEYLVTDEPTEMTDHGVRGTVAWVAAACAWPRYWLDAQERGDTIAMANAQAVLDAAPTWEWITADDGGGIAESLRATADGLRRGDTTHANWVFENNCSATDLGKSYPNGDS